MGRFLSSVLLLVFFVSALPLHASVHEDLEKREAARSARLTRYSERSRNLSNVLNGLGLFGVASAFAGLVAQGHGIDPELSKTIVAIGALGGIASASLAHLLDHTSCHLALRAKKPL